MCIHTVIIRKQFTYLGGDYDKLEPVCTLDFFGVVGDDINYGTVYPRWISRVNYDRYVQQSNDDKHN